MVYEEILQLYDEKSISSDELTVLLEKEIGEIQKEIDIRIKHLEIMKNNDFTFGKYKKLIEEEKEIGLNPPVYNKSNYWQHEDYLTHAFLEGGRSLYDKIRELKFLLNTIRYEKQSEMVEVIRKNLCDDESLRSQTSFTENECYPKYMKVLIDNGLIGADGKTVITNSLETVAFAIKEQRIVVTNIMLKQFLNGKTGKPYSDSSIKKVIEMVNC